jgi:glycosyltransferase involved in cell wall biosynthesis
VKIAYFSPFEPKRTGISAYSEELVHALRKLMRVDCFDFDNAAAGDPSTTFGDFRRTGRISDLADFDTVVYHMGNNPHYHLDIFKTMRQQPGIVVLHDTVLYFLIAGLGRAALLKYLSLVEGRNAVASLAEIIQKSVEHNILRYPEPEKHPLVATVFPYATRIIVHNEPARERILQSGYRLPTHVIPPLAPATEQIEVDGNIRTELYRQHEMSPDEIVIGCFGFIGRTKRIAEICRALARLNGGIKFRFLLVGEGEDVTALIRDAGLEDRTIKTGFVETSRFLEYLAITDILVNLRYPSMGESSWTLMQAQRLGKAVLVTRDGAFADLPDEAVWKIDLGPNEESDVAAAIESLALDPALRRRIGEAGRRYVETTLDSTRIADQFRNVFEQDIRAARRKA